MRGTHRALPQSMSGCVVGSARFAAEHYRHSVGLSSPTGATALAQGDKHYIPNMLHSLEQRLIPESAGVVPSRVSSPPFAT